MSAPPLPEAFGNYALGDFVEVSSPAAISWLPQTAGWLWLGIALLALLCHYGWKRLRHWYRNRYRREAMVRLQQLSTTSDSELLPGKVNKLLKLTALVAYSRERVASLSGADWADFLNRQCQVAPFSKDQRELLAVGAYHSRTLDPAGAGALIDASLNWVRDHRGPDDG